jgi:hypothetical protein
MVMRTGKTANAPRLVVPYPIVAMSVGQGMGDIPTLAIEQQQGVSTGATGHEAAAGASCPAQFTLAPPPESPPQRGINRQTTAYAR